MAQEVARRPTTAPEGLGGAKAPIRTPDQRLRVFVSSTLGELADERAAVRKAVGHLRLTPVMFEMGARPHPPRELYQAYLEQSHIFVGVYWERYGWIAPGMHVSGLEDEYRLAGDRPKLIYVKAPAEGREQRLADLIASIEEDGRTSYKIFSTPDELHELVENDLALLLTERFERADTKEEERAAHAQIRPSLPVPPTSLVGREREVREVTQLLTSGETRLVTLLGPGGIGKTRVALAVAERLKDEFDGGAYFVPLAPVREPGFLPEALVRALGLKLPSGAAPLEGVKAFLRERRTLVVLDNFEQVLEAAPLLAELLAGAPGLAFLVTSRSVLKVLPEYEYVLPALPLPRASRRQTVERVAANDAVRLFVQRARAVAPTFELDEANIGDVAEITRRLEGLPLAIELAAARVKFLSPAALLARLDKRLDMLTGGPRDLPDRQRTLRATFDWSFALLDEVEQRVFARLSMFVGGFQLAAAEAINADLKVDVVEVLFSLADNSLLQHELDGDDSRFWQLEVVREYAREKLPDFDDTVVIACAHRDYFVAFTGEADIGLLGHDQPRWLDLVERDQANIRAVLRRALEHGELDVVTDVGWNLWRYWWIRGQHAEARAWMEGALARVSELDDARQMRAYFVAGAVAIAQGDVEHAAPWIAKCGEKAREIGDRSVEGVALLGAGLISLYLQDLPAVKRDLDMALAIFRQENEWWGQVHALHYLWRYEAVQGNGIPALGLLRESVALFEANGDKSGLVLILHDLAVTTLTAGDVTEAMRLLDLCFDYSLELRNRWYLAYCFEGQGCVAIELGDLRSGARYFGLAARLRDEVQTPLPPFDKILYAPFITRLEAGLDAQTRAEEEERGRHLHTRDAVLDRPISLDRPVSTAPLRA